MSICIQWHVTGTPNNNVLCKTEAMFLSPNSVKISSGGLEWLLISSTGPRLLLSYCSIVHSIDAIALICMVQDGDPSITSAFQEAEWRKQEKGHTPSI